MAYNRATNEWRNYVIDKGMSVRDLARLQLDIRFLVRNLKKAGLEEAAEIIETKDWTTTIRVDGDPLHPNEYCASQILATLFLWDWTEQEHDYWQTTQRDLQAWEHEQRS